MERFVMSLDPQTKEGLRTLSYQERRSMAAVIRQAIRRELAERGIALGVQPVSEAGAITMAETASGDPVEG